MKELNKKELNNIVGGVSGAIITSVTKAINALYDLGRNLGSTIRRIISKRFC